MDLGLEEALVIVMAVVGVFCLVIVISKIIKDKRLK